MDAHRIELADVIASLRSEIDRAWREGQYDVVGFEAGPIEVELTTEVEVVPVEAKLSAKFWVLSAEAGAHRKNTKTQRITFSFTPKDRRDPSSPLLITGKAAAGEQRPANSPRPSKPVGE